MNRALAWSLACAAGTALVSSATAAPPPPEGKEGKAAPATFANTTPRPKLVGPLDPALKAEAVRAEQDALTRRLDVCNKLRQMAGGDDALVKQADRLEEQATALYHRRVGHLGVRSAPVATAPAEVALTKKPAPAPFKAVAQ